MYIYIFFKEIFSSHCCILFIVLFCISYQSIGKLYYIYFHCQFHNFLSSSLLNTNRHVSMISIYSITLIFEGTLQVLTIGGNLKKNLTIVKIKKSVDIFIAFYLNIRLFDSLNKHSHMYFFLVKKHPPCKSVFLNIFHLIASDCFNALEKLKEL